MAAKWEKKMGVKVTGIYGGGTDSDIFICDDGTVRNHKGKVLPDDPKKLRKALGYEINQSVLKIVVKNRAKRLANQHAERFRIAQEKAYAEVLEEIRLEDLKLQKSALAEVEAIDEEYDEDDEDFDELEEELPPPPPAKPVKAESKPTKKSSKK